MAPGEKNVKAVGPDTRTKGVDSARRVLQILLQFNEGRTKLTLEEIAEQYGISIPSVYRYVALLKELHLVEERQRGQFVLSPRILRLTASAESSLDLANLAEPFIEELVNETGETVVLMRRLRNVAICVASSRPESTLSISVEPGYVMQLHRGAAGKALLAALSDAKIQRHLDQVSPRLSAAERTQIQEDLRRIAETGFAETHAEIDAGLWGMAIPLTVEGQTVGALSLAGPEFRLNSGDREVWKAALARSARSIEAAMVSREYAQ